MMRDSGDPGAGRGGGQGAGRGGRRGERRRRGREGLGRERGLLCARRAFLFGEPGSRARALAMNMDVKDLGVRNVRCLCMVSLRCVCCDKRGRRGGQGFSLEGLFCPPPLLPSSSPFSLSLHHPSLCPAGDKTIEPRRSIDHAQAQHVPMGVTQTQKAARPEGAHHHRRRRHSPTNNARRQRRAPSPVARRPPPKKQKPF